MKLSVAQTSSVKGDVSTNITRHKKFINTAIAHQADIVIFPELSLTGYEPTLAKALATDKDDPRFNEFQLLSNEGEITIGVGMPLKYRDGISISMILFQPNQPRQVYAKQYLHPDENQFFISAPNIELKVGDTSIALAVCYEISIAEHTSAAFKNAPLIYIASVAKSPRGIDKAWDTLSSTAKKYGANVLMSNCIGECDGETGAGKSAAWNSLGERIGHLSDDAEGILIVDTTTNEVVVREIQKAIPYKASI